MMDMYEQSISAGLSCYQNCISLITFRHAEENPSVMYKYGGILQLSDRHSAKAKTLLKGSATIHVGIVNLERPSSLS